MNTEQAVGVVLAGGCSRRMAGREKSLLPFANGLLLSRILERFLPQVGSALLSANGDPDRYFRFGLPVIADLRVDRPGPLAGIEAAFLATSAPWIASIPVDVPFLPPDLIARLRAAVIRADQPVVARSGGRLHPVIALWPRRFLAAIQAFLDSDNRKLIDLLALHAHQQVDFPPGPEGVDPFFNVNDPDRLAQAERWAATASRVREAS
ncbi:MAG: molybdenum cofactor guanylyltransferase [Magnetococcales bacterium]|nr:molybdenum cofactor guanylyltransferase [Magnetococcales bacterium]